MAWFDVVELTNQTADSGTGALQEARTLTGMISKFCNPHTLKSYVSFYELLEEQKRSFLSIGHIFDVTMITAQANGLTLHYNKHKTQ